MTTSLAAVFIPILFMGGILGRLFREFAVTITTAILISGIVSVTLTPMLCSRFLRVVHSKTGFAGLMDRAFDRLLAGYKWSLGLVLRHRLAMLAVFVAVLFATTRMFGVVPKGFIPETDNDRLNIMLRAAQGTSYYEMVGYAQRVAALINQNPYVDAMMVNTGGGGGAQNNARFNVQLTPRATRPLSASQIAQQLRGPLGRFPGFRAFVNVPPALQIGGFQGNSSYNLNVQSLNNDELYAWAPQLEQAIAELPEVQDVSDNMELKSPRVNLVIDRDKAAAVGLNATQIENALSDGFGQKWTSTIYGARTQYRVLLELDPQYQERADSLKKISFRTPAGALIPLESVINFKENVGPQTVNHYGQLASVNISFGLKPGVSLGAAVDHVKQVAGQVLPATVTTSFQGSAKVFQASLTNLGLLLFIAIGVVYIVLGMLYESYIHPLTILSGLPSAALGALVTLWLFGSELNIYSFVGLIMLIGLVEEERDHADRLRARSRAQARPDAGRSDLRGLPHPLPSDHDDDDGRAPRLAADRAGIRRRRRGAAAARPRGRRRSGGVAAHHAVSDAGRLHLHGGAGQDAQDSGNCRDQAGHGMKAPRPRRPGERGWAPRIRKRLRAALRARGPGPRA